MSDEWQKDDPFAGQDPAAAAREERRREREERRRKREEKTRAKEEAEPEPVATQPPPQPSKSPEEEFWGEDPPPPPPPTASGRSRRSPWGILLAAVAVVAAIGLAVVAYAYLTRDEAPPPQPLRTITATIPEGYSRAQTAELARELKLRGNYEKATIRSPYLDPAEYGGKDAKNLEGFLFPDTFELDAHAPVSDLVRDQLQDFKRRIAGVDMSYAKSKNLTVYDVVTIASMIEKEAQLESERKLISAVIYNRLRNGIPLGIDATIRFANDNYTEPLTESELSADSPYNTRVNAGLPPGPIASPGLASIEAAAHPAKVDYLYYVVKPGTCGEHAFSSSYAEFEADVARYNEAREAAGGKSPTTCGE
ncbi:MAG TPA: endolytic transglycosylase MltG [Solirubrobacterales bacterium]|jgi:cell division protein YceG involved in septum cleavage